MSCSPGFRLGVFSLFHFDIHMDMERFWRGVTCFLLACAIAYGIQTFVL